MPFRVPWLFALLAMAAACRAADEPEVASTEAAGYAELDLEGWRIRLDRRLGSDGEHAELGGQVLSLLRAKLIEVQRALPRSAVAHLRGVTIWIEYENSRAGPGCCYHPSAEWLASHGFNPAKAKGVEICHARNFIDWADDQPAAILHEFAHAWHDQVLGWDESRVNALYDAAVASHRYDEVLHISGRTRRHYALTNAKEYFAEMSEAYFWTNDFYPFVRAELKEADPAMHELLRECWDVQPRGLEVKP